MVVFDSYRSVSVPNTSRQQNDANHRSDEIGLPKTLVSETNHESAENCVSWFKTRAQVLTMSNDPTHAEKYAPILVG